MTTADTRRRLIWHGVLLFFLGLLVGAFVQSLANPRLGLSAHVGTVMTGTFLALAGAVWREVRLPARAAGVTFWTLLFGSYVSSLGLFLAALFGTSRTTPIAGAGHTGTEWQEAVVAFALTSSAGAMLVACVLLLWGLSAARASRTPA